MKEYCQYCQKITKFIKIGFIRCNENSCKLIYKCKKCIKEGVYLERHNHYKIREENVFDEVK